MEYAGGAGQDVHGLDQSILYIYLSIYLSIHRSIYLNMYLSIYPSIYLSKLLFLVQYAGGAGQDVLV